MPAWLDRIVPNLSIESPNDAGAQPPAPWPATIPPSRDHPADTPDQEVLAGVGSSTHRDG